MYTKDEMKVKQRLIELSRVLKTAHYWRGVVIDYWQNKGLHTCMLADIFT